MAKHPLPIVGGSETAARRRAGETPPRKRIPGVQHGVLAPLPTPAPAGSSPPANAGRQQRAASKGNKPGILGNVGLFLDTLGLLPKKKK